MFFSFYFEKWVEKNSRKFKGYLNFFLNVRKKILEIRVASRSKGTVLSKVTNWQNHNIFHAKSEPGIFWHAPTVIERWRIILPIVEQIKKKNLRKRNHKVAYAIMFMKNSWYTFLCLQSSKTKITKKRNIFRCYSYQKSKNNIRIPHFLLKTFHKKTKEFIKKQA